MFTPDSILKAAGMLIALSASSAAYGQAAPGQYGFGTDATPQELAKFISIPADGRGLPPGSGNATAGAQVYAVSCGACHGDKLQGGPVAPALTGPGWRHITGSFDAILDRIDNGLPGTLMVPHPGGISESQVFLVASYIYAVSHQSTKP